MVNQDTENIFNDDFYDQLNGILMGVDNGEARNYLYEKFIEHEIPFAVNSGTHGLRGESSLSIYGKTDIVRYDSKIVDSCGIRNDVKN